MAKPRVAVLQLPGVNGEEEAAYALDHVGLESAIVPWSLSAESLRRFDAYVLPGGFSYQDRVRAGAVAARLSAIEIIAERAAQGAPVLGICNGAQILVESGLVPGEGGLGVALAPNRMPGRGGYLARWVWCEIADTDCLFTRVYTPGEKLPLPIAHAEGRFTSLAPNDWTRWRDRAQLPLRYVDPGQPETADGGPVGEAGTEEETAAPRVRFPWNPNGAAGDAAAICNPAGNVLAIMPHPERAESLFQVPLDLYGSWGERRRRAQGGDQLRRGAGPGRGIFLSLARELGLPPEAASPPRRGLQREGARV
jgi:phosphoribosylformylglycinamidine synthase